MREVGNVKNNAYIYTKLLYIDNKELVKLRLFLKTYGYKGVLKKKKDLEILGLVQTYATFLIFVEDKKNQDLIVIKDLENFLEKLKIFEFLQILGIIYKNILVINKTTSSQLLNINNLFINLFFCKLFIMFSWKKIYIK